MVCSRLCINDPRRREVTVTRLWFFELSCVHLFGDLFAKVVATVRNTDYRLLVRVTASE